MVTLSVDDVFAQPGIGVPGVSSTDTNHGLFIGGHPRPDRLTGKQSTSEYSGCIKNIVIGLMWGASKPGDEMYFVGSRGIVAWWWVSLRL